MIPSRLTRSFPSASAPHRAASAIRLVRAPAARVVALGGGTGLPTLLRGLKEAMFSGGSTWSPTQDRDRLTAVVTVADDGGSSGRLRRAYGVLPPGDLRNCLIALSSADPRLTSLFDYRFAGNGGLGGHNLGNLILTALSQIETDLPHALEWASAILEVRGRVLPASPRPVTLRALYRDGSSIEGESRIAGVRRRIRRVFLQPAGAPALPEALRAIDAADLIVLAPGSLFTSIIPVLLVKEIAAAIARSPARVALVMNMMTEPGETDGFTAADFVTAILEHAPKIRIDDVLLNGRPISEPARSRYEIEGSTPVRSDLRTLRLLSCAPIVRDLLEEGDKIRHDPLKLGRTVMELVEKEMPCAIRG